MTTINYKIGKRAWRITCEAGTEPPSPRSEFGAGSKGGYGINYIKARSKYG
jgi:hypothetical protein